MSNKNSIPTSIEQLPTEIFWEIFRYYDLREIVSAFFGLNDRINSIVESVRNVSHIVQYNDPDSVQLSSIFSKQIVRLIVIKTDLIDLTSFSNLRSLTLKYTNNAQLQSIRPQNFPLLEMLRIYVFFGPPTEVDDLFEMIFNNAFPRLWLCTAVGVVPLNTSNTWSTSPSLRFIYVPLKHTHDYARIASVCPNRRWIPSCKDANVDPLNQVNNIGGKIKQYMWKQLNDLHELESEGKFIPEVNPFVIFENHKHRSHRQESNDIFVYGRIFLQATPYCHTPLLIEIKFPFPYPFKYPEITFLEPVCNSIIDEDGRITLEWRSQHIDGVWKPLDNVTNILRRIININDEDFSKFTAADNEKPPKDVAEQLLKHLNILYPDGKPIRTVKSTSPSTARVYKDEVHEFFQLVDIYTKDTIYDKGRIFHLAYNHEKIAKATWRRIKQMLALLSRHVKIASFNDPSGIESYHVKMILLRIKELVE